MCYGSSTVEARLEKTSPILRSIVSIRPMLVYLHVSVAKVDLCVGIAQRGDWRDKGFQSFSVEN